MVSEDSSVVVKNRGSWVAWFARARVPNPLELEDSGGRAWARGSCTAFIREWARRVQPVISKVGAGRGMGVMRREWSSHAP